MEEAFELEAYLPLSFKSQSEENYVAFLWDAFRTNYEHQKYQFAFLAYHMLTMCCVYFNIWQIKLVMPREFTHALLGFNRDTEKELMEATSPFIFWRVNESAVVRLLKLLGCDDDYVSRCTALVKDRNESAHANGNIFFNDAKSVDKKIADVLKVVDDIEVHSKSLIERCYVEFLTSSQVPDDREHADDPDQLREVLIHPKYFSQKDVDACVKCDISGLAGERGFPSIHRLHRALRNNFSELRAKYTVGRPGSKIKLSDGEWEGMVNFRVKSGWSPSMPIEMMFVNNFVVSDSDAQSFSVAAKVGVEEAIKDSTGGSSSIGFDMVRFYEVSALASEGGFNVWVEIKSA